MEALFILLADLIILPITLFATLLVEGVATFAIACTAVAESAFGISLGLGKNQPTPVLAPEVLELTRRKAERRRKFLKRLSWMLGGIFALMVSAICVLNFVFFESTVRWGLARIEKRSGIKVSFTSASGSLFSGQLTLKGVTTQRHESAVGDFDLQAEEFSIDLSMTRLFRGATQIERVFVSGLKGEFHRVTTPERMKLRKRYEVKHLRLENAAVNVRDTSRETEVRFALNIESLDSQPLRSQFAVFDILFRSNIRGEIAGRPFVIQTKKTEHGRETFWQADGLPIAFAARQLGGPFNWLTAGTVDVRVTDKWEIADAASIKLAWSFVFQNLVVAAPEGATPTKRLLAAAITTYLRLHAERLDVSFNLTMNESQFEGAASAGAAGLWDATRDGLVQELSRLSGADTNRINQGIKTGIEKVKEHLENRRKSP